MNSRQFNLRRMFVAIALAAVGLWLMLQLETTSVAVWVGVSVLIGVAFGAAVGLLLNRTRSCTLIGAGGWLLFAIYAIIA